MEEEQLPISPPPTKVLKDPSGSTVLEWDAWENLHPERSADWYWGIGAIAFFTIILLVFFKNFLFALIIILATFSLFMSARSGPQKVRVKITDKGIAIGSALYLYESIQSFWIDEDFEPDHLIIHSGRPLFPRVEVSLEGVGTPALRAILSDYLIEKKEARSLIENLTHLLGF